MKQILNITGMVGICGKRVIGGDVRRGWDMKGFAGGNV